MTFDSLRYPLAMLGSVAFAMLLFIIMQWLIQRPGFATNTTPPTLLMERVRLHEPAQTRNTAKSPQQQKQLPPSRPLAATPAQASPTTPFAFKQTMPLSDFSELAASTAYGTGQSWGPVDNSLVILNRIEPVYPPTAARRGIEGWVKLRFNVDAQGRVRNAIVVNAQPQNLFDRAALQAVQQWRFKPRRIDGQSVATSVVQTLKFTLDK